jgi:succinate dehydrogenase / fumarate reductase cytochrome b subunit
MTMTELQAGSTTGPRRSRPLSPHIQIYRFMITYVMSGFHRVTGAALYFGMVLVAWWLVAAASGPNAYGYFEWFMGSLIGRLVLLGYTWALIHHALGGVRYLLWDLGYGVERSEREFLALATILGSVALTLVVWVIGYLAMGGPR